MPNYEKMYRELYDVMINVALRLKRTLDRTETLFISTVEEEEKILNKIFYA